MNLANVLTAIEEIFTTERQAATRINPSRSAMISAVNLALAEIGPITQLNSTLVVDEDAEDYALPAGVSNVVRVEIASSNTAPYEYKASQFWRELAGRIYFSSGKAPDDDAYPMRIWYLAPHSTVANDSDTINAAIDKMRLAWTACYYLAVRQMRDRANDVVLKDFRDLALGHKTQLANRYPIHNLAQDPLLSSY